MKPTNVREQSHQVTRKSSSTRRLRLILISVIVVFAIGVSGFVRQRNGGSNNVRGGTALFTVERGDLAISVTESGDIKAVKSVIFKSEVEGRATIVDIVPEGTVITPEDVNDGKVLAQLDSSKLEEQLPLVEIDLVVAEAGFADANESYLIQIKQNESDLTAAELKVEFTLMDLQKYLGATVAQKLVAKANAEPDSRINVAALLEDPNSLGGEGSQTLRELSGTITLAKSNLEKAAYTLEWTEKLHEKQYVAETELRKDRLDKQRLEIEEEKAEIALELFKRYEFTKQTRQFLSDYNESKLELERTHARARAQLAQARAKLGSARSTFEMQKRRLKKVREQIEACTIRATAPGEVVYWSSMQRYVRYRIEQGEEIPEGYKIIAIPDASKMKVDIKVHENWIGKIQLGQEAKIRVEAFSDKTFTGKVTKKAPLADKKSSWDPDVKVYKTEVIIEGTHDFLKTGMTAKVEVLIAELQDVLYVPMQSVVGEADGTKVCYVSTTNRLERREVETGLFNDDFVEIRRGLTEGEKVSLNPVRWTASKLVKEQAEGKPEPVKEQKEEAQIEQGSEQ